MTSHCPKLTPSIKSPISYFQSIILCTITHILFSIYKITHMDKFFKYLKFKLVHELTQWHNKIRLEHDTKRLNMRMKNKQKKPLYSYSNFSPFCQIHWQNIFNFLGDTGNFRFMIDVFPLSLLMTISLPIFSSSYSWKGYSLGGAPNYEGDILLLPLLHFFFFAIHLFMFASILPSLVYSCNSSFGSIF